MAWFWLGSSSIFPAVAPGLGKAAGPGTGPGLDCCPPALESGSLARGTEDVLCSAPPLTVTWPILFPSIGTATWHVFVFCFCLLARKWHISRLVGEERRGNMIWNVDESYVTLSQALPQDWGYVFMKHCDSLPMQCQHKAEIGPNTWLFSDWFEWKCVISEQIYCASKNVFAKDYSSVFALNAEPRKKRLPCVTFHNTVK